MDFDGCIMQLRTCYNQALSESEGLRAALERKDAELKGRYAIVEQRLAHAERASAKLAMFKNSLLAQLQSNEDIIDPIVFPGSQQTTIYSNHPTHPSAISDGLDALMAGIGLKSSGQLGTPSLPASRDIHPLDTQSQHLDVTTRLQQGNSKSGVSKQLYERSSQRPSLSGAPSSANRQADFGSMTALNEVVNQTRNAPSVTFSITNKNETLSANGGLGNSGSSGSSNFNTGGNNQPSNTPAGLGSVDGREFFKLARSRLSYDDFTCLLNNVKAYNARDQSRQKTLEVLNGLLGERHRDLYDQFEQLLSR